MTILLLIRHGENDVMLRRLAGRMPGVILNEKGRRQALELAEALTQVPLNAVYSSPLERAVETARPLAERHHLEVQDRPALMEADYGEWQGKTYKQLGRMNKWKGIAQKPSQIRFPGGESFIEVQQRAVSELDGLVREWQLPETAETKQEQVVAVVTHADIISLSLTHYLNMALDDFLRLSIAPASISIVQYDGTGLPKVIGINQPAHFTWPEPPRLKSSRTRSQK